MMDEAIIRRLLDSLPDLSVSSELSRGGQKVVYQANSARWGGVVVKIIMPVNATERRRALREIAFTKELNSNCFSRPLHFGEFSWERKTVIYVIEELLPGQDLRNLLREREPNGLPFEDVKRTISTILDALAVLEPQKLVHRDIKPENIIVAPSRVALIDFGIARKLDILSLTETYAIFGPMTPGYAPPEQIRNEKRKISTRTDLFALGVVTYEALTGLNPFFQNADDPHQVVRNVLEIEPPSLESKGFHPSFDAFVMPCLSKACHRRPSSATHASALFDAIVWED